MGENVTISYTPRFLYRWLAAGFRGGARSRPRQKIRAAPANRGLRLVPGRREQIATAADGADHSRLGRVRLDLPADAHDPEVHGPVESLAVAGVGQLEQPFARQHPLRVGSEHLQETKFGRRQGVLVALVVAQRLAFEIEPFGAEPHQIVLGGLAAGGFGCGRRRLGGGASPQHRADAGHQFAQLARLCDVIVRAEFEPDHTVDRACGRGQHDDGDVGAALEVANDGKPVFLGHVEVEHDEIGSGAGFDGAAQAFSSVAQRHDEAMHLEIIADHLPGRRLVIDDEDVLALAHDISVAGSTMVKVEPLLGPALSAVTSPPCMSMMRLTMDSPSPVELSPAVGLAESRWKRPNRRPRSSGDSPAPWSATRMMVLSSSCLTVTEILPPIGLYLMALETRLSIASRMRSVSHMVTMFGGANTAMACCLLTASG